MSKRVKEEDWPVEVVVFEQQRYGGEWMPEKLTDAVAWLQGLLEQVPAEHRDAVKIDIDSTSSYEDSHYATIKVSYWRPPTAEEREGRLAEAKARRENARSQEIAMLRSLQAKYGSKV